MNDLLTALALLTALPLRRPGRNISARAFAFYPPVGLGIGIVLAVVYILLRLILPSLVVGSLVVALWAALTGALHLDGFADACDGLFATATRERRLEILRDVHLGAFGAVGLVLLLTTKVAAAGSLQTIAPLLLAPVLGRWAMVYAAAYPPARQEGMAVMFRAGLSRREILIATAFAAISAAVLSWFGVASLVGVFLLATLIARLALRRLGGLTGDIYGMICESAEATTILIGVAMLK